jgi:hypothetical protein
MEGSSGQIRTVQILHFPPTYGHRVEDRQQDLVGSPKAQAEVVPSLLDTRKKKSCSFSPLLYGNISGTLEDS